MRTRPYTPNRHGWTPERQQAFLAALRQLRSTTAAAADVGMSRESAYWLRRQPHSADFARQWDAALTYVGREPEDDDPCREGPGSWSSRRLVRWLERLDARQDRADRTKMETL